MRLTTVEEIKQRYDSGDKLKLEIFYEGDFIQSEKCSFTIKGTEYYCVDSIF